LRGVADGFNDLTLLSYGRPTFDEVAARLDDREVMDAFGSC
jgi:hypothetical protein